MSSCVRRSGVDLSCILSSLLLAELDQELRLYWNTEQVHAHSCDAVNTCKRMACAEVRVAHSKVMC
eukprot:313930-Pelagomonas_calceolata.AAC.1